MRDDCYTIRFDITDKAAFEPERKRFAEALMGTMNVPGAKVTAVSMEDEFAYSRYSDYLVSCLSIRLEEEEALSFDEWCENGQPKTHVRSVEYKREEE